jgi:hypothetical protein
MTAVMGNPADTATEQNPIDEILALRNEYGQFREAVRTEILYQHTHGSWCLPGTQGALRDLGLPQIVMNHTGNATISVRIRNFTSPGSLEEARNRVIAGLTATCSDDDIEFSVEYVNPFLERHPNLPR